MNTLVGRGVGSLEMIGVGVGVAVEVGIAVGSFNDLIRSRYEQPLVEMIKIRKRATTSKIVRRLNRSDLVLCISDIV
jgi:hypothetical protein